MKNKNVSYLTQAAMIAAIYVVLTAVFAPISFGEIQIRIAEMLTVLPLFIFRSDPWSFCGMYDRKHYWRRVLPDIICGSLATLIGAVGTYVMKKKISRSSEVLPPILANIVIVPFVLRYAYGILLPIPFLMFTVGVGEVFPAVFLDLF